jgi:hypothetical protein
MAAAVSRNSEPGRIHFERIDGDGATAAIFRYRDGERSVHAFFADGGEAWAWRKWRSDAPFLAIDSDAEGSDIRWLFAVGGSFLELAGERVYAARRSIARWEWTNEAAGPRISCSEPDALERNEGLLLKTSAVC